MFFLKLYLTDTPVKRTLVLNGNNLILLPGEYIQVFALCVNINYPNLK